MSLNRPRARRVSAGVAALAVAGLLSACNAGQAVPGSAAGAPSASAEAGGGQDGAGPAEAPRAVLTSSVDRGASAVPVDTVLQLGAQQGEIETVSVTGSGEAGELAGTVADGAWTAQGRLEPGTTYAVRARLRDADGSTVDRQLRFSTADLSLDQQTFASVAPLQGETVGVGMPVVVTFDVPVTDRASIERHLAVQSTPAQQGSWHWLSDTEVHYRPKTYWQSGTKVHVDVDVNSVAAGNGIYGQESRSVDFTVGDANIYQVDARTHQMKVFSNEQLLRTLPITTGKEGFTTRSGTKVIIEKFDSKRMNSETVGIAAGSSEAYDIDDVQWAMRLTYSGEFIHAAPWSVGSQGRANVSHGCTGMSTDDAAWLYRMSKRGDVVEYVGTDRPMTLDNGFGDWNASFADYRAGSALA